MSKYLSYQKLGIRKIEYDYLLKALKTLKKGKDSNIINGMKVQFNMDLWGEVDLFQNTPLQTTYKQVECSKPRTYCNTAACLAGHMIAHAYADGKIKNLTGNIYKKRTRFRNLEDQITFYRELFILADSFGCIVASNPLQVLFVSREKYITQEEVAKGVEHWLITGKYLLDDQKRYFEF